MVRLVSVLLLLPMLTGLAAGDETASDEGVLYLRLTSDEVNGRSLARVRIDYGFSVAAPSPEGEVVDETTASARAA